MVNAATQSLTFEEYLTYDDGTDSRCELVDGQILLIDCPPIEHFLIAKFLKQQLDAEIRRECLSWLTLSGAGIRTGYNKSRLSDLCMVTKAQAQELLGQSAVFQTAPLLIVEVVSPDSIARDYRYKRSEYAALAIPEYWIVDPLESQVTLLVWEEGWYEETQLSGDQAIKSPTFPDLLLTVEQILKAGKLE